MESKPHQCDVFINHRGPDVKKTFVAHLDGALRRDGFRPFLDGKDIGHGRHVFNTIDKALKDACVHVAIFSKRYAESKYCLDELCSMLSSGKVILPVFYDVKPEDLRRIENGPFKAGFAKHMERNRGDLVPKWKEALVKVADYRGFRLDEVNENEEQLIRSILVEVRRLMPIDVLPGKHRYGLTVSMDTVVKLLDNTNVVGLVGMGGIGKTTLAEEVFNHFRMERRFERYCFLRDVRSRSSESLQVQQELLRGLGHHSELQSISPDEYTRAFNGVMRQRVLIIIDDIDHYDQFAAIIPEIERLGASSRVVITSRRRDVLVQAMASAASNKVYEVPLLNEVYSRQLFNRHAFLTETPSEGFVELAGQVADACGGHALLLKTIGASLFDKKRPGDEGMWKETMKALRENGEVFDKLRSTYDSLPTDGDRAMFREIACMLIGMEQDVALRVWKSCDSANHHCSTSSTPAIALRRLVDRSLVKVVRGRFGMHDVLRDMGRDIVKKEGRSPGELSYLWDTSIAQKVLSYNKMNTTIRGMVLASRVKKNPLFSRWESIKDGAVSFEMSQVTSMKELHFLVLDTCDVLVLEGFSSWPQELRWLEWEHCCFSKLPSQFNLPSLVVLDLSYNYELTQLWEDDALVQLPLLEILDLSNCWRLEELAENVGQSVPKLKILKMECCNKLRRLPSSIGHLTVLEHLDLAWCEELVHLPEEMKGLTNLRQLNLRCCEKLQQLPKELGKLTNLRTLDMSCCDMLSELPASIGGLKMLEVLDMTYTQVTDLPEGFGLLISLTTLKMPGISSIQGTLEGLQALTFVSLYSGSIDVSNFGAFSTLKGLNLSKHATAIILPKSLGNLKQLVKLEMKECPLLVIVEALPMGLEHLNLCDCPKLVTIPSLASTRSLIHLNLRNCKSLQQIYGLECLTTLEFINIAGCTSFEDLGTRTIENRALQCCYLNGSKIGLAYNSSWSKEDIVVREDSGVREDPAIQMISYSGDTLPVLSNSMSNPVAIRHQYARWSRVLEASIASKAKCIALIWCMVVKRFDQDFTFSLDVRVQVWRSGRLVTEYASGDCGEGGPQSVSLPRIEGMGESQVCIFTMRREHHIVRSLQHADQIFISCRGKVVEGGICTVHKEDDNLVMVMNSELLSSSHSQQLESQFSQLVLKDDDEQLANPEMVVEFELLEGQDQQLAIPEMNFELQVEDQDQQPAIPEMNFQLQLWSGSPLNHESRKRQKTQLVVEDDDQQLQVPELNLELKL